jgi:oligopeptide/dipeptide ABC transporter ATP-binding protein
MLLAAFSHNPRLRRGWTVSEAQRRTVDAAVGCAYADRCPRAQAVCRRVKPPLGELAPGHFARCHFPVERS